MPFTPSVYALQDDTVKVYDVVTPPVINGTGDDACWNNATWQTIDQVWINYGEVLESSDYSGRYKTVWSSKENLLYFLVEINDNAAIGGFVEGQTADVYNFDIAEVFIDEDHSGGPHIYDNPGTGENAENAFAYHIYADFPMDGEVDTVCWVGDIPRPYTEHIPEFALRKTGNLYTREFSLKVYDDTYENDNPEASRVTLTKDKIMGLSLAYCDNDEDDGQRDNFFGSVWVPEANYNDHWMNADDFGVVKLYSDLIPDPVVDIQHFPAGKAYPNPVYDYLNVEVNNNASRIEILGTSGSVLSSYRMQGQKCPHIQVSQLSEGIYYAKFIEGNNIIAFMRFVKL
ncbi:MAG: T9SS type A sorting domain-containing protein [Bacteroidales bacterium]|nr:T9SS type A sorting domain-containing protein [Bacteroidales bacterium]